MNKDQKSRVLIVSLFAIKSNRSSTAQNTRNIAQYFVEKGAEVQIVTAGEIKEDIEQDDYILKCYPLFEKNKSMKWYHFHRPNEFLKKNAKDFFKKWKPDIIYSGAIQGLQEFIIEGGRNGIPVYQMIHDYSLFCLKQWLVKPNGDICNGPKKSHCKNCIEDSLGKNDKIKNKILSFPIIGKIVRLCLPKNSRYFVHVSSLIEESFYLRKQVIVKIKKFISQGNNVSNVLKHNTLNKDDILFLPQYIGKSRLIKYDEGPKDYDRIIFCFIGRWTVLKGKEILVKSFNDMISTKKVEMWIITPNRNIKYLEEISFSKSEKNKKIKIFNDVNGKEVSKLIAKTHCTVVPSIWKEVGPRVILESFSQGIPVITTNYVGENNIVIDNFNGALFDSTKPESLTAIMENIVKDPITLKTWSKNINHKINKEDWYKRLDQTKMMNKTL